MEPKQVFRGVAKNLGLPAGEYPYPGDMAKTQNPAGAYLPANWCMANSHVLREGALVDLNGDIDVRTAQTYESECMVMCRMDIEGPIDGLTPVCQTAIEQVAHWREIDPYGEPLSEREALMQVWAIVDQFYGKGQMGEEKVAKTYENTLSPRDIQEAKEWENKGWDIVVGTDHNNIEKTIQVKNSIDTDADREKLKKDADELVVVEEIEE